MRFKLSFELEKNEIDIDYRRNILSWIKHSVEESNNELYLKLYGDKTPIKKIYTFAPVLVKPKFENDRVILKERNLTIYFSAYNYIEFMDIINCFIKQKGKAFKIKNNIIILQNIELLPEQTITENSINIKMLSPLIVRDHDKNTRRDMYYSFRHENFAKTLKINISGQLENEGIDVNLLENFEIIPIEPKKTVVKVYEQQIECSLNTFKLIGDKLLLEYLYKAGMGSKKGLGFGMFKII